MASAHLYFAGGRLSTAELTAACLDGHLVPLGDAYIPADAVETAALRAGSIAPLMSDDLVATALTAAWIHGATAWPPARHRVQRVGVRRRQVFDRRVEYHDTPVGIADRTLLGGVWVTTPARTLADLLRSAEPGRLVVARHLMDAAVVGVDDALTSLDQAGPLPGKRHARALLETWRSGAGQLEVTR